MTGRSSVVALAVLVALLPATANAQWFNYPAPGVPRLPDGKVNMSAPAPRTADGKPDLTGVWRGAGPLYRFNIAQDLKPEDIQPWAEALFLQRVRDSRKDSPLAKCLPVSVPFQNFFNLTRMVQTPTLMMMLYESPNSPHRTIFMDGRDLPKDPNPTWLGYSIGRWDGDWLVVTTSGFNDKAWLDSAGHPQTESLRITERMRRRDFGHMDYEITIDDPKAFTRPFTIKRERLLAPDTDLLEDFCDRGVIANCHLTDIRVAVIDGKYHTVDSSEMAFKTAGSLALRAAVAAAKPILLEPIMTLTVTVPDQFVGDVMGNLNSRRGRVAGVEARGHAEVIKAHVPMAEVLSYASDLTSMTGGQGSFDMEFSHYEEAPAAVQERVVAEAAKHRHAEE